MLGGGGLLRLYGWAIVRVFEKRGKGEYDMMRGVGLPVNVDVQSSAEVMRDSIDHNVEDDGCKNTVSADDWEIWLALPAQPDTTLAVFAADVFAEGWVLNEDAEREEA